MKVVINPAIHPYQSRCSPGGGREAVSAACDQTDTGTGLLAAEQQTESKTPAAAVSH